MYQTEADFREERNRRIAYVFFTVGMLVSVAICGVILFLVLAPAQGKRLLGQDTDFAVGEVAEIPVKRLELSKLLPNAPQWSDDIIFLIKQPDRSYQAFLGLDPSTGCKINWREQQRDFVDNCSQTVYTVSGRNANGITTLESRPANLVELPVETEDGAVYVLDQRLIRDRR